MSSTPSQGKPLSATPSSSKKLKQATLPFMKVTTPTSKPAEPATKRRKLSEVNSSQENIKDENTKATSPDCMQQLKVVLNRCDNNVVDLTESNDGTSKDKPIVDQQEKPAAEEKIAGKDEEEEGEMNPEKDEQMDTEEKPDDANDSFVSNKSVESISQDEEDDSQEEGGQESQGEGPENKENKVESDPQKTQVEGKATTAVKRKKLPPGTNKEEYRKKREAEKEQLRLQKLKEKEEKERQRLEEKERKEKEKEDLRKKKEEEKEEQRKKREEEKEEQRKKREEELRQKKELKEKERIEKLKQKEDEKKKKEDEKQKKMDERKKQEEERQKQKEEAEREKQEKLEKRKSYFSSFFTKVDKEETPKAKPSVAGPFMQFEVKKDMQLAPVHRVEGQGSEVIVRLDRWLSGEETGRHEPYLKQLKSPMYKAGKTAKPDKKFDDDDVVIMSSDSGVEEHIMRRMKVKFLSFHENNRPPYYGTWRKLSDRISPKNPLKKDELILDYEVDSDDEWEEEEPGESVSTDDEQEEEEKEEEKDDDDDEDGFFVPHGYLSEGEGGEDDEEVTPESLKARQLAKARAFEEELKRKTEALKPICIGPMYSRPGVSEENPVIALLKQFQMICLQSAPISLYKPVEPVSAKKNEVKQHPAKQPVPEDAYPDLIRLLHGNSKSIKKIHREFAEFLWQRQRQVDGTETPCEPHPDREEIERTCGVSKRQLFHTIKTIAVYERRETYKLGCWYVHEDVLAKHGLTDLPVPTRWKWLTKTPAAPSPAKKPHPDIGHSGMEAMEIDRDNVKGQATDGKVAAEVKMATESKSPVPSILKFAKPMPSPLIMSAANSSTKAGPGVTSPRVASETNNPCLVTTSSSPAVKPEASDSPRGSNPAPKWSSTPIGKLFAKSKKASSLQPQSLFPKHEGSSELVHDGTAGKQESRGAHDDVKDTSIAMDTSNLEDSEVNLSGVDNLNSSGVAEGSGVEAVAAKAKDTGSVQAMSVGTTDKTNQPLIGSAECPMEID